MCERCSKKIEGSTVKIQEKKNIGRTHSGNAFLFPPHQVSLPFPQFLCPWNRHPVHHQASNFASSRGHFPFWDRPLVASPYPPSTTIGGCRRLLKSDKPALRLTRNALFMVAIRRKSSGRICGQIRAWQRDALPPGCSTCRRCKSPRHFCWQLEESPRWTASCYGGTMISSPGFLVAHKL